LPSKERDDDDDTENNNNNNKDSLMASKLGLDPTTNRFHAPLVYHERYSFADWPPNHTFPMDKFERIAHALRTTCSRTFQASNLPRPIVRSNDDFFRPLDLEHIPYEDWFFSVIDEDFVTRFLEGMLTTEEARYIGFREQTHRPELIERTVLEVAGTILTCQLALRYGIAANVAGGTHHAHPTGGAGYTILNDLAVASNFLLKTYGGGENTSRVGGGSDNNSLDNDKAVRNILVVDCDVHQGDGTAKFSIPGLHTLSLHCASNYPRLKAHSTYDVGIHDGCRDDEYLEILETNVNRAIDEVRPDFVIYDAGVDVYEHDRLGRLNVSEDGIRQRDRWVLDRCVSAGIPVAAVVGGGYDKDVDALARRHAIVHEECAFVWRKYSMWKR
jgi:acetoin utilization deacetylase AcuC-like enzyme